MTAAHVPEGPAEAAARHTGRKALAGLPTPLDDRCMQTSTHPRTVHLTPDQCLQLLGSTRIGRLGVIVAGRPEIYSVNHTLLDGDILFRSGSGTKLDAAAGQYVAYQADGFDPNTTIAWSVLVGGVARVLQLHETLDLLRLPVFPWEPGAKPHLVRIHPETISGRQFVAADLLGDVVVGRE